MMDDFSARLIKNLPATVATKSATVAAID